MKNRRDITQFCIMIILAIVPLIFVPYGEWDYFYYPKLIVLRIIVIIFLFVIYQYRNNLKDIFSTDWINKMLLIYFTWLIFSTLFSMDFMNSIVGNPFRLEGLSTLMLYFAVFLIARHQGTISKRNVNWMLITGCIVVLYGVMQSYGIEFFQRDFIREDWIRPISSIGNPNFLGSYIVLLLPFSIQLFIVEKRIFGVISYGILFFGLLATLTRGAWIGAFLSIMIYGCIILYHRKKLDVRINDIVIIVFVTIICFITFDLSNSGSLVFRLLSISKDIGEVIFGGDNLESSGAYRMFIWLRTVELIQIRPLFGFGIENLHLAFERYFIDDILQVFGRPMIIDRAHNEYLHIAVSSGIPALVLYLGFLLLVFRKGMLKLLETPYAIPLLISFIGYSIQAFFNISVVSVAYIFWVILGFIASSKTTEEEI